MSPDATKRLTVAEAAEALGITQDAVRKRIKRDSIGYERGEDARLYVYVDMSETPQDNGPGRVQDHTAELIRTLQEQLEAERQAHAESRRIIAGLVERIPALEAPSEAPQAPTEATEQPGRVEPQPAVESPHEGAERRSWWRRVFGG